MTRILVSVLINLLVRTYLITAGLVQVIRLNLFAINNGITGIGCVLKDVKKLRIWTECLEIKDLPHLS